MMIKLNNNTIPSECDGMALIADSNSGWERLISLREIGGMQIGDQFPNGEELICILSHGCTCDACLDGFPKYYD